MVGYAMAAVPPGSDIPWQRVINSQGKISPRGNRSDEDRQMEMLEDEGVYFDHKGKVNFEEVAWPGPDWGWLAANGFDIAPGLKPRSRRAGP
jgi:methylated-DNA-protein-cysteine methyltransferase-like protein